MKKITGHHYPAGNLRTRTRPSHRQARSHPAPRPSGIAPRCDLCQSDEHLMLHSMDPLPPHNGELLVHVIYVCTTCGSFYGHPAPVRHLAELFPVRML